MRFFSDARSSKYTLKFLVQSRSHDWLSQLLGCAFTAALHAFFWLAFIWFKMNQSMIDLNVVQELFNGLRQLFRKKQIVFLSSYFVSSSTLHTNSQDLINWRYLIPWRTDRRITGKYKEIIARLKICLQMIVSLVMLILGWT